MKREVRRLYVACRSGLCCALVSRADEHIDWVLCSRRYEVVIQFCSSSVVYETSCYVDCGSGLEIECLDSRCEGGLCAFVESLVEELYRLLGGHVEGVEA